MWSGTMCLTALQAPGLECDVPLLVPRGRSHVTGQKNGSWRLVQLHNGDHQPQLDQRGHSPAPELGCSSQLRTENDAFFLVPRVWGWVQPLLCGLECGGGGDPFTVGWSVGVGS